MTRLTDVAPGSSVLLQQVGGERAFRRRLMELGFLPGTCVRLVRGAGPGDLLELEVRGCHLSLRRCDARQLFVRPHEA